MVNKDKRCCGNCIYWQDHSNRVYARISDAYNKNQHLGILELRPCRWRAHPSVETNYNYLYLDENFYCEEFKESK